MKNWLTPDQPWKHFLLNAKRDSPSFSRVREIRPFGALIARKGFSATTEKALLLLSKWKAAAVVVEKKKKSGLKALTMKLITKCVQQAESRKSFFFSHESFIIWRHFDRGWFSSHVSTNRCGIEERRLGKCQKYSIIGMSKECSNKILTRPLLSQAINRQSIFDRYCKSIMIDSETRQTKQLQFAGWFVWSTNLTMLSELNWIVRQHSCWSFVCAS